MRLSIHTTAAALLAALLTGCSSGDLRLFNDALSGDSYYYPDQNDTEWVGDIKWTTGIRDESGYQKIYNSGDQYCKIRVSFEDDTTRTYRLDPGDSTGQQWMSIYNQATYMETICSDFSSVYNESFDD